MITQIDLLIKRETRKAIKAILESSLSDDASDQEKRRQDRQQSSIAKRDLKAHDADPESKDEAEGEEEKGKEKEKEKAEKEPEKREDRTKGRGTADSPKLKTPDTSQIKNPKMKAVVDKLNALRGGKSLKDPAVRKSFEQYFESLTLPEKQSLLLFLTGIAQVLAGTEVGDEALEPADAGLRVKDAEAKKQIQKKKKATSKSGTEENPIIVGEVASKSKIMKALKAYRENS